jgi:hypothetical protein
MFFSKKSTLEKEDSIQEFLDKVKHLNVSITDDEEHGSQDHVEDNYNREEEEEEELKQLNNTPEEDDSIQEEKNNNYYFIPIANKTESTEKETVEQATVDETTVQESTKIGNVEIQIESGIDAKVDKSFLEKLFDCLQFFTLTRNSSPKQEIK